MKKKLLLLALLSAVSLNANASDRWSVHVSDDLFSETGEKAILLSGGRGGSLLFECENSQLDMALLLPSRQTYDDEWGGRSISMRFIIKVDDHSPMNFVAQANRRNENYMQAKVSVSYSEAEEILPVLKQIEAARSKVLVGLDAGEDARQSSSFGVSGSTAATERFLKACGLN